MNTTRTATQRLRQTAAVLALGGAALTLSACGSSGDGVYQTEDRSTPVYLQIDGDQAILTSPAISDEEEAASNAAAEKGQLDPEAEYIDNVGTIDDDQTVIKWQDGSDSALSVDDSMAMLDDEAMLDYDSDQAQAQRDELAED